MNEIKKFLILNCFSIRKVNWIKALHLKTVPDIMELPYKQHNKKGGEHMPSDKEMLNNLIDVYSNLQRIKNADNVEKELNYQLTIVKIKLESFGIVTSELDIKK